MAVPLCSSAASELDRWADYFNDREEEECQNEKSPHEFQS